LPELLEIIEWAGWETFSWHQVIKNRCSAQAVEARKRADLNGAAFSITSRQFLDFFPTGVKIVTVAS
jgi:hypothetical protein